MRRIPLCPFLIIQTKTTKDKLDKGTKLRQAAKIGDVDKVKKLIAAKANLEDRDEVPSVDCGVMWHLVGR